MKTRKPVALLTLLLLYLIAMPPAVLADDTELFTTSANPNVLLMLDTTGSMDTVAGTSSVGDLDGDSPSNSRMDVLWKVVYTLLNADLSIPSSTGTYTTQTAASIRTWYNPYNRIQVNGTNWNYFPDTNGTIQIGSGGTTETVTYSYKSVSWGRYYFNFSPSHSFQNSYGSGAVVSISGSSGYSNPYPVNHTEAISTDFQNNLSQSDEEILKARLGLMTFTTNSTGSSIQINIRNQIASNAPNAPQFSPSYQDIWSSVKQYAHASGGTPTAQALSRALNFFDTAYNSSQVCRQNFAVLITDGEDTMGGIDGATGNGGSPDYYSGSGTTGTFYSNGYSGNTGQVGRNNAVIQEAADMLSHNPTIKLFTVGVGISDDVPHLRVLRDVLRRAAEQTNDQATSTEFNSVGTAGADDTSRGAGRAFFATDANELSVSLRNIFHQISAGTYMFTSPTVASVRMTDRNYLYKATFVPSPPPATLWPGHLEALTINNDNTYTSHWDAATVLQGTNPASRRIYAGYTDNTSWSRLNFTSSAITPAMLGVITNAERNTIVDYVRGVGHDNNLMLGDIFHSKPVVIGPPSRFYFDQGYSTAVGSSESFVDAKATRKRVIYVGTNDGMLHGFLSGTYNPSTHLYDQGTGEELFGFIPYSLLNSLSDFVPGDVTTHGYYIDSSPRAADIWIDSNADGIKQSSEWRTIMVVGFRKGGSSYFALDVTDPPTSADYTNYPKVLWEYSDSANLAQTWSEPFIGKVRIQEASWTGARDRWVAIFGGGVSDAGTVGASLVVLDLATGTALKTFTTGIDDIVAASPTVVLDANGYIKFAYVVDLDGSLYKFNFRQTGLRSDSFDAWSMKKIFQASSGQPAYHRVEPASITETSRYLFFGTGNQNNPVSDGGTGKFYAIQDTDTFWPSSPLTESDLANLSSSITSLTGGVVGVSQHGWLVDFLSVPSTDNDGYTHTAEKVLSDPVVFYNNVYFSTYTPDPSNPCSGGGVARVYGLQMLNGGASLASLASLGETSTTKVPYHVYAGSEGGIPSSPSLSINPAGQSSIFVGFSTGSITEIAVDSPLQVKSIKSWRETY